VNTLEYCLTRCAAREAMLQFRIRNYSGRPAIQHYGETLTGRMGWMWAAWL
jgi:hypothetical protein